MSNAGYASVLDTLGVPEPLKSRLLKQHDRTIHTDPRTATHHALLAGIVQEHPDGVTTGDAYDEYVEAVSRLDSALSTPLTKRRVSGILRSWADQERTVRVRANRGRYGRTMIHYPTENGFNDVPTMRPETAGREDVLQEVS